MSHTTKRARSAQPSVHAGHRADKHSPGQRRRASQRGSARGPSRLSRWLDRALALAADAEIDVASGRLRALRRFVLAWGATRSWIWLAFDAPVNETVVVLAATALSVATGLAFTHRFEHVAARLGLAALVAELLATIPLTHNHFFVELYAVAILSLSGRDPADDPMVLAGLRWLTVLVLFHTGLQKLLYGHYWRGDFLAFMVGRGERFADLFRWILPPAEIARLASHDPFREGAGPYRVSEPLFVAASNLVWIAEVALPAGLILRRTRAAAAFAALAFVLVIQLGAREMGFALLFGNLLLLFAPAGLAARLLPLGLGFLGLTLLATSGLVPGRELIRGWHLW